MARGGRREGAGRKGKADEQKLVEKLGPLEPEALSQLSKALKNGQRWAVELFFKYQYGMPKQQTDVTPNGESVKFDIRDLVKFG